MPEDSPSTKPAASDAAAPTPSSGGGRRAEFDWFDKPKSRALLWKLLFGACVFSLLLELLVIALNGFELRKPYFPIWGGRYGLLDGFPFFYGILGFAGCYAAIFAAKGLGYALKVGEDYYGDEDERKKSWDLEGGDDDA